MTVTNIDVSGVQLSSCYFFDELLTFAGSGTVKAGTILARATSTGKLIPYVKGGSSDGNGVAVAVLAEEYSSAGAGDVAVRALVTGLVRAQKLVIDADGDNSNVDHTVLDGLRDYSIVALEVEELNIYDNQ